MFLMYVFFKKKTIVILSLADCHQSVKNLILYCIYGYYYT